MFIDRPQTGTNRPNTRNEEWAKERGSNLEDNTQRSEQSNRGGIIRERGVGDRRKGQEIGDHLAAEIQDGEIEERNGQRW